MRLVKSWICILYLVIGVCSALAATVFCETESSAAASTEVAQIKLIVPEALQSRRQIVLIQWLTQNDNSPAARSNLNY